MLAEDAVLYSDGGGNRAAALNPIHGADRIARFFAGVLRKNSALATVAARPATINGLPAPWCMNSPVATPVRRVEYQRIRAETGMPKLVIRLSTLHRTCASVRC
jgi:RNA polymerase sigma-70 factor (ECF subfamily)